MPKLKTQLSHEFNSTRETEFGTIKFDENGVTQELTQEVYDVLKDMSFVSECDDEVKEVKNKDKEAIPKAKAAAKNVVDEKPEVVKDEVSKSPLTLSQEDLTNYSDDDLREILATAGFSPEEIESLKTREDLLNFFPKN